MKRAIGVFVLVFMAILFSQPAFAENENSQDKPWEKFSLHLGAFISDISSDLRFGSGIGIDLNAEDFLGMDTNTAVFRVDGAWRFTKNRLHRLDLSWFAIRRDGNRQILEDFTFERPSDGVEVTIPAGTKVESVFNVDIYKLDYSYSFFQDDRFDLALSFGLFIMPIEFGFTSTGAVNEKVDESITAPLPAIGFRGDFALTSKWFLRMRTEIFYLEIEQFKGSLYNASVAVEYKPWKHVGIGLGVDTLRVEVEAEGQDYPGIDFKGAIEFTYMGLQLYTKIFF
jgi:hypothetical protein